MERRRYPRQACPRELGLQVSILLSGGSLINQKSLHLVELEGKAVDVSRGGLCLSFEFDPDLSSLDPKSEVDVVLRCDERKHTARASIVHIHEGHKTMGLKFVEPLGDLSVLGIH